jgi:PKD repeat protein
MGDGTEVAAASATHRYTKPGRYSMTLFADDGAGQSNSKSHITRSIWVNRPPHASAGPDRMTCPGQIVQFDGSASSDADGKLTRLLWDFGDGNTHEGAQAAHKYEKPGNYQVRLTVTDDAASTCSTNTAALNVLV